jgi:hypothetical protein
MSVAEPSMHSTLDVKYCSSIHRVRDAIHPSRHGSERGLVGGATGVTAGVVARDGGAFGASSQAASTSRTLTGQ